LSEIKSDPSISESDNNDIEIPEMEDLPNGAVVQGNFLSNIARYFRDFLDTDFKRQRLPKRQLQRADRSGNLTGITISKYPTLVLQIWKRLLEPIGNGLEIKIVRGRHKARINPQLSDLIEKYIDIIPTEKLQALLSRGQNLARTAISRHHDDPERCKAIILSGLERDVIRSIVVPLLKHLEPYFDKQNIQGFETVFDIEDELGKRLVTQADEAIGAALNTAIIEKNFEGYDQLISDLLQQGSVQTKCLEYFSAFAVSDIYAELYELTATLRIKENMDIYLYVGDLNFNRISYPLFYLPLHLTQKESTFQIHIDPHLYINKKAIDYLAQETARAENRTPRTLVEDRILYLTPNQSLAKVMQGLADKWISDLSLRPAIDFINPKEQIAKSSQIAMTNRLHFAAFDKSDESLLNDYEALLGMLDSDDPLATDFRNIVERFLSTDPSSVTNLIDKEWDEYPIEDRLVYKSPIPLNEEQRRVQMAIRQNDCRFVVVQGPPGTGKSHTITAIAFDVILNNQNVLILSDKKEALDVVEDKIKQTLNNVRLDTTFQNPILRLGKSSNTYHKIVSTQAIDKIKTHYRVAKAKQKELNESIQSEQTQLKNHIKQTSATYQQINIQRIFQLIQSEKQIGPDAVHIVPLLLDIDTNKILSCIRELIDLLSTDGQKAFQILQASTDQPSLNKLDELLQTMLLLIDVSRPDPLTQTGLQLFNQFENQGLDAFTEILQLYEECRWPIIGFFFTRKRARKIDRLASEKLSLRAYLNLHQHLRELKSAHEYLSNIHQLFIQRRGNGAFLTYAFQIMSQGYICNPDQVRGCIGYLSKVLAFIDKNPEAAKVLSLDTKDLSPWLQETKQGEAKMLLQALWLQPQFNSVREPFIALPHYDYSSEKSKLESLHTRILADTIDERVIEFHEAKRATSRIIRDIIRKKQKFPTNLFADLKKAFPCIIANIRDYAEYMPLAPELFDLIIIDEASQVSIAQAFPAMLRAKKMVVLGDAKQFSNVKTTNASKAINNQYVTAIQDDYIRNNEVDANVSNRLSKFNIKTSILDFVEMLANYSSLLKKHFRGYKEHISYSSSFFYDHQLQAVKIRGLPVSDVLEFALVEDDGKATIRGNANELEAKYILNQIELLLDWDDAPSVGIITPFTDQQRYLSKCINDHPLGQEMYERLKLKCMTFDSCQGEERDYVYYSMVATTSHDRLYGIFPKGSARVGDPEEALRLQRLNVGFSRVKEKMIFVLSKSISEYSGALGEALRHYDSVLRAAEAVPTAQDVDPKSPMEAKLLEWLQQTAFYQENHDQLEIVPQFPIGEYLSQLDPGYNHPAYRVDFLLKYRTGERIHQLIIEYDGFEEHFTNLSEVAAANYTHYYKAEDVEREKILESYGYRMLRVNRFNMGRDPVATLSDRLIKLTKDIIDRDAPHELVEDLHNIVDEIQNGDRRVCKKCGQPKPLDAFKDNSLKSGYGRVCIKCKGLDTHRRNARVTNNETQNVSCPRCGNAMVLRKGRYGKFYGCSRYPFCKGTRNIR
jgi:very-short-patch-repair endonuclease